MYSSRHCHGHNRWRRMKDLACSMIDGAINEHITRRWRRPFAAFARCGKSGEHIMDMDKPDGQRRSRVAELVAVVALLAVGGGYFIYQSGIPSDARSELAQNSGTEGGTAAGATSNSGLQQLATNARPTSDNPTDPAAGVSQSGQTKAASLPTSDIAYVQRPRANIRSEANPRGPLVGRAYKGTKLSVVSRSGKWVQIANGETKGWVSARLIGPRLP
jgi:SH3 domain-containing protein